MDDFTNTLEHPKKRRRRAVNKPALSARLVLDETLRGDTGFLSDDIYGQLFVRTQEDAGRVPRNSLLERFHSLISPLQEETQVPTRQGSQMRPSTSLLHHAHR